MEKVQVDREMKKGLHRNQKGLTLVELLAVIVILGIITAIAIPSIGGLINKTKKETHRANAQIIIDSARMKIAVEDFSGGTGTQKIYMAQLNQEGYLEKLPEDPENKGTSYSGTYTAGSPPVYDGSFVDASKGADGKITYKITLIGKRDGAATETKYFDGKAESEIKTVAIN